MKNLVIPAPETPIIPVKGGGEFPVRRVYCVGRNYAAHAVEMGYDPDKEPPFFFQKNPDNLDSSGVFEYPPKSNDVHHEVELLVAIGKGGADIPEQNALDHVYGYAVALDMTRRDLQAIMKKQGRPWEIGKAFEGSAPVGPLVPVHEIGHLQEGSISLDVNGAERQTGDLNHMIWKVPEMISYLSSYFKLAAGDVILTGTPAGVGPVEKDDVMVASIAGLDDLHVKVV